jgi:apolipoprotein N-acyltransferase
MPAPAATLTNLAHSIVLAWGWRRAAIGFVAGAVSALAIAPINAWPVMFLTFPVLVWLVDGSAGGRLGRLVSAAAVGWWFGFGYLVAGLYWVGIAFLVDAKTFAWLMPLGVVALPAWLALTTAIGVALARLLWCRGASRVLALAIGLTFAEWLRGYVFAPNAHIFSGFPWNAFGYAFTGPLVLAQASALVGLWGLTFLVVLICSTPALLADDPKETPHRWLPLGAGLVVLAALAAFGALRLASTPTTLVPGVHLRIMQPNLAQDEKFNRSAKQRVMSHYLTLSDRATGPDRTGIKDVTHLIWPESAFPFFLPLEPDASAQIAAFLPKSTVLLTGGVRPAQVAPSGKVERAYNSIYLVDHGGSLTPIYDKVHLVPFGEYLPFQSFLESIGLMQLTKVAGGFVPGDRHRPVTMPGAPSMLPLICYEIIFPDEAVPPGERPGWLLNLTNDGWFGISSGPYQHFQQARVRAIEQGLPLVRAANTGISAVIDPLGRVIGELPLGTEGVLDAPLPARIGPPPYRRFGDITLGVLFASALLVTLRRRWQRR